MEQQFWNLEIFQNLSAESKQSLENIVKIERSYLPNELILSEEDEIQYVCIVLEGCLKSSAFTIDGKQQNASFFFEGDIFPLYMIYGGVTRYFFNTYSITKSRLLWIHIPELIKMIDADVHLIHNVLRYVSQYACYNKLLLRALHYNKVMSRLAFWLLYLNNTDKMIKIPHSQEVLANILHVNRTSLNLEFRNLEKENIITKKGKYIIINDKKILEQKL